MKSIDLDRLHDYLYGIGGCDADDNWSKGWDEAVDTIMKQVEEWSEEPAMIVKFQRAILGGNKVLVYDKGKNICQEIPLTKDIRKLFGSRYKMYRKCTLDKSGFLHIGREVKAYF